MKKYTILLGLILLGPSNPLISAEYTNHEKIFESKWQPVSQLLLGSAALIGLGTIGYTVQQVRNALDIRDIASNPIFIAGVACTGLLGLSNYCCKNYLNKLQSKFRIKNFNDTILNSTINYKKNGSLNEKKFVALETLYRNELWSSFFQHNKASENINFGVLITKDDIMKDVIREQIKSKGFIEIKINDSNNRDARENVLDFLSRLTDNSFISISFVDNRLSVGEFAAFLREIQERSSNNKKILVVGDVSFYEDVDDHTEHSMKQLEYICHSTLRIEKYISHGVDSNGIPVVGGYTKLINRLFLENPSSKKIDRKSHHDYSKYDKNNINLCIKVNREQLGCRSSFFDLVCNAAVIFELSINQFVQLVSKLSWHLMSNKYFDIKATYQSIFDDVGKGHFNYWQWPALCEIWQDESIAILSKITATSEETIKERLRQSNENNDLNKKSKVSFRSVVQLRDRNSFQELPVLEDETLTYNDYKHKNPQNVSNFDYVKPSHDLDILKIDNNKHEELLDQEIKSELKSAKVSVVYNNNTPQPRKSILKKPKNNQHII